MNLFCKEKNDMIQSMNSILIPHRITCVSWLPHLRSSGSEIFCDQGYKLGLSVGMVLREHVGSPLVESTAIFLGLEIFNCFSTWEGYLVGVSLGALGVMMIFT